MVKDDKKHDGKMKEEAAKGKMMMVMKAKEKKEMEKKMQAMHK